MAGDLKNAGGEGVEINSFNSRPRMAGDRRGAAHLIRTGVSIHARAWRATLHQVLVGVLAVVSIHARAWRATLDESAHHDAHRVSIHARAWRATWSH